ncbi:MULTISPECIES: RICIN domain-containing protein [unclassified Nonomuraea]|uniref:RICIN domain-containing protein n=1 Tax=Nonomuraea sp. KC401 TaxID=1848324 RepID=UPI00191BFD11|nr:MULTISPECIES: RICIN domain-containing protein [unclassified Nonomuraea]
MLAVLAAAILALTGAVVAQQPASAASVDTSAWYVLVNRHSGKALDLYDFATADGAPIVQWARNDGDQQQWQFVSSGDGYYRLRSRHSGKVLDVYEWSTEGGADIVQWADLNAANQQFRLADSDGGHVRLINRNSGMALEVWEWGTGDGARISQWDDLGGANQQWRLVKMGGGSGSGDCGSGSSDAEAVLSGGTWTARNGGTTHYTGGSMIEAMRAAVGSLTSGRTSKQKVIVRGSGSMNANQSLDLPSYTVLEVCGTINVSGSISANNAVVRAQNVTDVEVTHLNVTGNPYFGVFVRNGTNITLGRLDLRLGSSGLGVRIDNHANRNVRTRNVRIDSVYASGGSSHGVETYGVDGIAIGTVTARNTGESGLLFNDTINATVGTVDAQGAGTGTGYAAFRMANRNGRIGSAYPANVRVGTVIARGGGRGIFCVSESGGAVIDRVDISGTGSNSILIENCYNVTIAAQSGTVNGSDIRIAARGEFPVTSDITLQNLTLTNSAINENPCGNNIVIRAIELVNSQINRC